MEIIMYDTADVRIMAADVLEKSVDAIPGRGILDSLNFIEMFLDGNAMTEAINAAKIGLKSAFIGSV